ncbi:Ras GTPase-activating-like IQGAP3, partial [Chaetura pelagica]
WLEACLGEELPPPLELEETLRNGVVLAKLGHCFAPSVVPLKKIYDHEQTRYKAAGLHFRHTDNINYWRDAMSHVGLPLIFHPETTDIYDKKNMPRVVYCIHALSLYLFKLGLAPQIQDLYGKVDFTEEEINNMKKELEKYGLQIPAFSKIGGILANELSVDEAAVHAAVLAINQAVDEGVVAQTMVALSNPSALLLNLRQGLAGAYQEMLHQAKLEKGSNARNRVIPEGQDIYDQCLTQAEIQENINKANVHGALEEVDDALENQDTLALSRALQDPVLALPGLWRDNLDLYLEQLSLDREQKALDLGYVELLEQEELEAGILLANRKAEEQRRMLRAVGRINAAIRQGIPEDTLEALRDPPAQLPPPGPRAGAAEAAPPGLFQPNPSESLQGELVQEEVFVAVEMLSAVALVNQAVDAGDPQGLWSSLVSPALGLSGLEEVNSERYFEDLVQLKGQSREAGVEFLTWSDIQDSVNGTNSSMQEENQRALAVQLINEAVGQRDPQQTLAALLLPGAALPQTPQHLCTSAALVFSPAQACWRGSKQRRAYLERLRYLEANVAAAIKVWGLLLHPLLPAWASPPACLVSFPPCSVNRHQGVSNTKPGWKAGEGLGTRAGRDGMRGRDEKWERELEVGAEEGIVECEGGESLGQVAQRSCGCPIPGGVEGQVGWGLEQPGLLGARPGHMGHHVKAWGGAWAGEYFLQTSPWFSPFPLTCFGQVSPSSFQLLDHLSQIQAGVRMWLVRRRYQERLSYFRQNVEAVVTIQAFVRGTKARGDYRALVHARNPPLSIVRRFAHLLEQSQHDFWEEAEVLKLQEEVVKRIRAHRQLESDLDLMDIKIGLLVKNRITLQEVVSHCKKLTKKNKEQLSEMMSIDKQKGLKSLSKEKRQKLEAYQHLFYLLQTQPVYLARLIFQMPQNKSTKFMESVIFTLYNYASNPREAFLLLQLFKAALQEEIRSKVDHVHDILTGNAKVIQLVVTFYRRARGQNALRQILGGPVEQVLQDRTLSIRTDPVDIYKAWVNQSESQSGQRSELPYEVSPEQALSHPEVQRRLDISIRNLLVMTDKFVSAITSSVDKIPYGMRYVAKILRTSLAEKFPKAPEEEIDKIVGNLLYYRFMNPAVVAPDGFDIVDISAGVTLHPDQRRSLGSIAKVLQHLATHRALDGENTHLCGVNSYLENTYHKFRKFISAACCVPEPEERFNIDKYSELVTVAKPVIYITVGELINTHKLLLEHQDSIAPHHGDPLHELLEDLEEVPMVQSLVGENIPNTVDTSADQLSKLEISLTLTSKLVPAASSEESDTRSLLLSTKQMLVDVIQSQPGDSLQEILWTPASQHEEASHQQLLGRQALWDAQSPAQLRDNPSLAATRHLSLEEKKRKIIRNLRRLESLGLVASAHHYQELINQLAKDIREQRRHRQQRRGELLKLRETLEGLNTKTLFYEEQIDYYNQYIKTCLDNLAASNSSGPFSSRVSGKAKKLQPLHYTAAQLLEKGVLLEIEDLPHSQFKNVIFDISPCQDPGRFQVTAKFLGIDMEHFQLHYQDLLQLQYEGVAVMKMFNKAKVNVNLLIFLLNKKFFKK